jgi:hypothetical protein
MGFAPRHGVKRPALVSALALAAFYLFVYVVRPALVRAGRIPELTQNQEVLIGASLAFAAAALSFAGRRVPERWQKLGFGVLATIAIASYIEFGGYSTYERFVHRWEVFHYYTGARYARELGYTRIYACVAVAESQLGPDAEAAVRARKLRNLTTDTNEPAANALIDPAACTAHFTPERWNAFRDDVRFFRTNFPKDYWEDMQDDHGYNPPPVWTLTGNAFASLGHASIGFFEFLAALDPLLLATAFLAIAWAFGWRLACIAVIFFGTQTVAASYWTIGAFLRQDWLCLLVVAICLLRKGYPALGGAALAWSALLRIFPAIFFAGALLVVAIDFIRRRRVRRGYLRFFAGATAAGVILIGASTIASGVGSWRDFAVHLRLHESTPLTNYVGLRTLFSYDLAHRMKDVVDYSAQEPFGVWKQARRDRLERMRFAYWTALVALVALTGWVLVRVRSLWIAVVASLPLVASLAEITCYYWTFFVVAVLLTRLRPRFTYAPLMVAGLSQLLMLTQGDRFLPDDLFALESLLFVGLAIVALLSLRLPRQRSVHAG